MYTKRFRTYKRTGFELIANDVLAKQNVNAIYDSGSYMDASDPNVIEAVRSFDDAVHDSAGPGPGFRRMEQECRYSRQFR